ncbi:MAG: hypothetical protein UU67_C0055G0007 [Candidatus Daviesbacteria bacterium GW2011_GWB1_41_5]|uniref:Transposase IS200-like domain-containing protein n=1 Tax=Candidatus Daviesbacteria bacterium GW2011_GWB1_41_5 TaxID=1618429 RepID=A0A0G0WJQ4_9BACT|nr:MAG: hypothetical protein UU67_C0055G0007 [Candidatus Daviesbacteria bacterium GW2011_GWB1_41_5]
MPSRTFPFSNGYFYHIFNRGSEKRSIFETQRDYQRFLKTLKYYQILGPKPRFSRFPSPLSNKLDESQKVIEIIAFCLMPNHFHLLLRQNTDRGITEFTSKLSNSYTKYYNTKHTRVGPLFQGEFKAVLMESDEQLVHVSRYIHLNPVVSGLVKQPDHYQWSSYREFLDPIKSGVCLKDPILGFFKNPSDYQQFVLDQIGYAQELEFIKHQLLDAEA